VNLLLAIALFIGLVWLTFRWLEFHTNHGDEIPVPNVVNMTVQQAIEVLDDQGLEYEVDSFKFDLNLDHIKFYRFSHHQVLE
jgi:serine/threonine-protein kinase